MNKLEKILGEIKKDYKVLLDNMKLSEKRITHIDGCVEMAYTLAGKYGINQYKAVLAALMHDYFREVDNTDIVDMAKSLNIKLSEFELQYPRVLHGKVAAKYFSIKGYIKDSDILEAIKYHTLGEANISDLAKLIFIVDAVEINRKYLGVEELRNDIENINLNEAYILILKRTIIDMIIKNKVLAPATIGAYNYMMEVSL
ncbi:MAG: bis(5'-nucleosyl)-tetraphosphatase (symmetrical) YqeK [Firmicutes bacterium]|nr:bis(5'-nucleosyl)-tetraphosphatase (symmetrical) YqeK [Bacillota bacterium]